MQSHHHFMQLALEQARLGLGHCAPNPAVGAVLVRDGSIISQGYHQGLGQPHAEVAALCHIEDASGCDLYVTLEPCCHYGRTPPCTELIIQKRVARVFFGYLDPNPIVAGKGQAQLQQAGIPCDLIELDAVQRFYSPYKHWSATGRPWITVKIALSDQGGMAIDPLTGPEAQLVTHRERLAHDAILTTANTILHDDPQLNARLIDSSIKKSLFVLDSKLQTPVTAKIFDTCEPVTMFYADDLVSEEQKSALIQRGAMLQAVPTQPGQLSWQSILKEIGRQGVHRLWVEAGWRCVSSLMSHNLVDELICYIAPHRDGIKTVPVQFSYESGCKRDITLCAVGNDVQVTLVKAV